MKRVIVALPLIFLFLSVKGQDNNAVDSFKTLNDELRKNRDSIEESTADDSESNQGYDDTVAINHSIYFVDKSSQVSGGGPDSLKLRSVPDSAVQKLRSADEFWYVDYLFEKEKKEKAAQETSFTESTGFQTFLWLLIIGGFAAFVVIYLANSNIGLFRKRGKDIASKELEEIETDNIFEINYQREIDKAIANGNYRFAVRLMFLRVLKNLSDKKIIQYKQDRTNFDYLMQLHATKYYRDFFRLTRDYEYSWYGQFAIEREQFAAIRGEFESFDRNLNNR